MLGDYGPQYSLAWFSVLWRVYRLLAAGRFAFPLRAWVVEREEQVPPSGKPADGEGGRAAQSPLPAGVAVHGAPSASRLAPRLRPGL